MIILHCHATLQYSKANRFFYRLTQLDLRVIVKNLKQENDIRNLLLNRALSTMINIFTNTFIRKSVAICRHCFFNSFNSCCLMIAIEKQFSFDKIKQLKLRNISSSLFGYTS